MNTKKLRFTALFVSLAVLIVSLAGIVFTRIAAISAEATYNPAALFATSARSVVEVTSDNRIMFLFDGTSSVNNAVNYNHDLAYKWFSMDEDSSAEEPTENYFSLEFKFNGATFKTFTITFQSAENSKSTDGVTENQVVFYTSDDGNQAVAIRNDDDADVEIEDLVEDPDKSLWLSSLGDIKISFGPGENSGEYAVTVAVGDVSLDGTFTNIRGAYAEYTASELIPLSFAAELPAEDTDETVMFINSLNGQSFALDEDGRVVDDTAPVLVVNDDIKGFALGTSILNSFSYETIDVCDSTVSRTLTYYQYNPDDEAPSYLSLTSTVKIFDKYTYTDEDSREYISVCFSLNDDDNNAETYYLSWYAADDADVTTFGETDYLSVSRDEESPEYTCITTDENNDQTFNETEAYQNYLADVAAAAENLRAGEGYSFYLPSLEDLITDNDTAYTGLSFTIYYKTDGSDSASTRSNLSYDELEIPVGTTGKYIFKVVAADKQGNAMQFYRNGRLISVDSDNVWNIDVIPEFSFYVENKGLEVEESEELSYAYVYSPYEIGDFTVKGLSGYESKYTLFYLDNVSAGDIDYVSLIEFVNECYADKVSADDFMTALEARLGTTLTDADLRTIHEYDSNGPQDEDDEGWDTHDNRYNWRESSLSFTPQESGYYILYAELVDSEIWSQRVYAYQVVYASSEVDMGYGETYWIENNIVTIVFIVIAVVAAIALLVIWITFPSKETVENAGRGKPSASGKYAAKRKKSDGPDAADKDKK